MGLGLDICKKLIAAHEGSIEFDSRPGRTEFRVKLPLLTAKAKGGSDER
jgi:two-component system nitrogen regulation sensor histidine kinase GlnL